MTKKNLKTWEDKLAFFDEIIDQCPNFDRKGKTMPYTSDNGHMFSLLNKDGEIGVRLGKDDQQAFIEKHNTTRFKSHGAFMNGYVLVPEALYDDMEQLIDLFNQGHAFVKSLPPK